MAKRANGEGCWQEKVVKGNTYQVYIAVVDGKRKSFYGKTKKEALQKYRDSAQKVSVEKSNEKLTFYQYCHQWLHSWRPKNIKQTTFDYYDSLIELFIKDTRLGKMTIKEINNTPNKDLVRIVQAHINSTNDKSKSTNDGIYTIFNQVCKYAIKFQDLSFNFMEQITKLSERDVTTKRKEIKAFEYSEVMKLWDEMQRKNTAEQRINGRVGTYVYGIGAYALVFCCFTGLRWGEVSRLQWGDIKVENGQYYFKVDKQYVRVKNREEDADMKYTTVTTTPKSAKSERYIPLSNQALQLLEMVKDRFPQYFNDDHLIFSTTNNPYSESVANRLLKAMCIRAGLPLIAPHSLRHSFASILLNEDEKNLYAVADMLGHSSTDVTYKRYIEIFEKNKVNAVKLFDNLKQ